MRRAKECRVTAWRPCGSAVAANTLSVTGTTWTVSANTFLTTLRVGKLKNTMFSCLLRYC
jgi:hypothetical protein